MLDSRLRSPFVLGVALALGACTAPSAGDPNDSTTLDAGDGFDVSGRRHHPPADARMPPADASPVDGGPTGGGGGGDPTKAGIISCYTEGNPGATCALPTQCCFGNYTAQHDGECSASACVWGTIDCDGPEDCGSGQHCCAHVIIDPDWGILGYKLACQSTACGAAPANQEMCQPTTTAAGTCGSGRTCVTTSGNDSDLPPSLHICK
jgi:hypothetical protein